MAGAAAGARDAPSESFESSHGRLHQISARVSGFERQVEEDLRARKDAEQATYDEVYSRCARLEQRVRAEVQQGEDGQNGLRSMLGSKLAEAQGKLESLFLEKFDHAHAVVDAMQDRQQVVETSFVEASEIFIRDMTEDSAAIHGEYWEFRRGFQDEIARHHESGRLLNARIIDLVNVAAQRAAHEQQFNEQKWCQLAREAKEANRAGQEESKHFQDCMMARVDAIKRGICVATKDREQADDDVVAALNHYTQALQGTISSVSRSALLSAGM